MDKHFKLKLACYMANTSMSVVGNLSPILFLTFRSLYGISYSKLGLLVFINFTTQLTVDLLFSFFSHRFNIPKAVKLTPVLTSIGLLIYAIWPFLFPDSVYMGLVMGTVIFSASGGLVEVLLSPVIAALPAEDPDREVSKLHSIYAWGVVFVIIICTLFLHIFGMENWQWMALMFMVLPLSSCFLFAQSEIPALETPERASGALELLKNRGLWLCFLAIFLGGASECTMAQWCSGYLEKALAIPKVWGDIFGVAVFSLMLGLGRTLYTKLGGNISRVLFVGAIGAALCYLTAAISSIPLIGLAACALTGFCVSMFWPGSLIVASDRFPSGGVFVYAMMAAGGDLGASVGPQMIGIITDAAAASGFGIDLAQKLGLTPDQLGMKLGMLVAVIFPVSAIWIYYHFLKTQKNCVMELKER